MGNKSEIKGNRSGVSDTPNFDPETAAASDPVTISKIQVILPISIKFDDDPHSVDQFDLHNPIGEQISSII